MTAERYERMQAVLENRTRYISVILEDIYQPHNASAVLRSCDCYGVQQVFTVESRNKLDVSSGVTMKAHQWLTLNRFRGEENSLKECITEVKKRGYLVAATTPHTNDMLLDELPIDRPVALMFGAEKEGLTPEAKSLADCCVRIPMFGFSESLNLSVSAAISLYEISRRVRKEIPEDKRRLSDTEKAELLYEWMKLSIRKSGQIEEKFLSGNPEKL